MKLRERVTLPEGFRWLEKGDLGQPFSSDDEQMDKYTLADYLEWGGQPESAAIVRDVGGRVAAVAYVRVDGQVLFIEMLARNKLLPYPGTGAQIVFMIEFVMAPVLGVREFRLEARPKVVAYYDNDLEFEEYAGTVSDPEWPEKLTPKRKRL